MPETAGKRPYCLRVGKHVGTKTEAELEELREKYKDPLPDEMIDFIAERLADTLIEERECGEILGEI